jgi:hypothetical protein
VSDMDSPSVEPSLRAKRSNPYLGTGMDGLLRRLRSSQ